MDHVNELFLRLSHTFWTALYADQIGLLTIVRNPDGHSSILLDAIYCNEKQPTDMKYSRLSFIQICWETCLKFGQLGGSESQESDYGHTLALSAMDDNTVNLSTLPISTSK